MEKSNQPEKQLIEAYKRLDEIRNLLEDVINELGRQQSEQIRHPLPEEIQKLVDIAINLKPKQREHLMMFLNSLKES